MKGVDSRSEEGAEGGMHAIGKNARHSRVHDIAGHELVERHTRILCQRVPARIATDELHLHVHARRPALSNGRHGSAHDRTGGQPRRSLGDGGVREEARAPVDAKRNGVPVILRAHNGSHHSPPACERRRAAPFSQLGEPERYQHAPRALAFPHPLVAAILRGVCGYRLLAVVAVVF